MSIFSTSSMESSKKEWLILVAAVGCMVCFSAAGICFGVQHNNPAQVLRVILSGSVEDPLYRILVYVRIPRVAGALLAGSSLGVSGLIIQSVLNNPLASPNVIGVNAGAGFFVLLSAALFPVSSFMTPFVAFVGAVFTAVIILIISSGSNLSSVTVVLTGFAVTSIFGAGMNTIMILYPDAYVGASTFLVGGLSGLTMSHIVYPGIYILAGLALANCFGRELKILSLGKEVASTLGMNVKVSRVLFIGIAAILAGAAVSFSGLLGFVGLVVPHAIRFLAGDDNRFLIPVCALAGAAFVVLCDLLTRVLFAPYELPVGILMSFIGGPFFLFLMIKQRR